MDPQRLLEAVGSPELRWIWERIHARVLRGERCEGVLRLNEATGAQRRAAAALSGEPGRGRGVSISLERLGAQLRESGLAQTLEEAATVVLGEAAGLLRTRRQAELASWRAVFAEAGSTLEPVREVLGEVEASGLLKRLAEGSAVRASALVDQLRRLSERLPSDGRALARLAAEVSGDAHALDEGRPLGTLGLRLALRLTGETTGVERREAWARVGVLCDELSAPVLVLNLLSQEDSAVGEQLRLAARTAEPVRLSVRQLVRARPRFPRLEVLVCENPTVVAAAADLLGTLCPPVICTEGMPKTATHLVLAAIREAEGSCRFHVDFDWAGLTIGNLLMKRHQAAAFNMSAEDYLRAPAGPPLAGRPVRASWAPALTQRMAERNVAVHEEQVLEELVARLARTDASGPGDEPED